MLMTLKQSLVGENEPVEQAKMTVAIAAHIRHSDLFAHLFVVTTTSISGPVGASSATYLHYSCNLTSLIIIVKG